MAWVRGYHHGRGAGPGDWTHGRGPSFFDVQLQVEVLTLVELVNSCRDCTHLRREHIFVFAIARVGIHRFCVRRAAVCYANNCQENSTELATVSDPLNTYIEDNWVCAVCPQSHRSIRHDSFPALTSSHRSEVSEHSNTWVSQWANWMYHCWRYARSACPVYIIYPLLYVLVWACWRGRRQLPGRWSEKQREGERERERERGGGQRERERETPSQKYMPACNKS